MFRLRYAANLEYGYSFHNFLVQDTSLPFVEWYDMPHIIRIKRTAFSGEEKRSKKDLRPIFKERIHDLVKEGVLSRKVDKLMKQGKLKMKVPTTSEIKVNDKAYKELLYVFKAYKIPFKRIQKGIELDVSGK